MTKQNLLSEGTSAFQNQEWSQAYQLLSDADQSSPLQSADLEMLAIAAYLVGKPNACIEMLIRAHTGYLQAEATEEAIRCAFWIGFILLNRGDQARGSGWIARAGSLLKAVSHRSVLQGYLLLPQALMKLSGGQAQQAFDIFMTAGAIGESFRDRDLSTLCLLGRGQALLRLTNLKEGVPLLDEAMAALDSGETSPIVTGIVYCAMIDACFDIFDIGRAQEWTSALNSWCDSNPGLVPFRGQCLIRRSQILQLQGSWEKAIKVAQQACELLATQGEPGGGSACYQLGELYRLQGKFEEAEKMYQEAITFGRQSQPGLALLWLARDKKESSVSSISRILKATDNPGKRILFLPAYIEIMLAADNTAAAEAAAHEFIALAGTLQSPFLIAMTQRANGAVHLAKHNLKAAVKQLSQAKATFEMLRFPYESAKTSYLLGRVYKQMGDVASGIMELNMAQKQFEQLRALPDLTLLEHSPVKSQPDHGLSPREQEVVQLVAKGKSNKQIAEELFISIRTVERHISNLFSKLNVSSRNAITAFAFKHGLK